MKKLCLILITTFLFLNSYAPEVNPEINGQRVKESLYELLKKQAFIERVNLLLESIKLVESGGNYTLKGESGEIGAYQFTNSTYRMYSYLYFKELLPMTPENQDKIAKKKIENLIKAGFTNSEIYSIWNCGKPDWKGRIGVNRHGVKYNVPYYVDKANKTFNKLKEI